jgi:hypothetical protein
MLTKLKTSSSLRFKTFFWAPAKYGVIFTHPICHMIITQSTVEKDILLSKIVSYIYCFHSERMVVVKPPAEARPLCIFCISLIRAVGAESYEPRHNDFERAHDMIKIDQNDSNGHEMLDWSLLFTRLSRANVYGT